MQNLVILLINCLKNIIKHTIDAPLLWGLTPEQYVFFEICCSKKLCAWNNSCWVRLYGLCHKKIKIMWSKWCLKVFTERFNIIQHLVIFIYIHNHLTWDSLLIVHLFSFLRPSGNWSWPVKLLKMRTGICEVLPSDFSFAYAIFHFLFVLLSIIFSDRYWTSNVGSNCRKNVENLENVDNILMLEDVESSASRLWARQPPSFQDT